MNIPDYVRISGIEYKVKYVPNLNDGCKLCYGHIDFDRCEIQISKTIEFDEQKQIVTLLHEVIHGIIEEYNVDMSDEESAVKGISKGLFQVIRDNEFFRS